MKFVLSITLDNDAYYLDTEHAVAQNLREVATYIEEEGLPHSERLIGDANGNASGWFGVEVDDEATR